MRHLSAALAPLVFLCLPAQAQDRPQPAALPWTQLSRGTCNVDAAQKKDPKRDGRGVVIAVLDTGVDPGVAGLKTLPGGGPKVVDIQDFSGQGDLDLLPASLDAKGQVVRFAEDGSPQIYIPPVTPEGAQLWFATLEEAAFSGSGVEDVDDDGQTDGVFGILVVAAPGGGDDEALVFVDTDRDRSFADERGLANYRLAQDTFTLGRAQPERQTSPLTFSLNVFLRERRLSLCFDDGGHGTHVAGIAAGYGLLGQPGFDGVAPGAQVISLKIGDARLGGGATTTGAMADAFAYAANYAREHGVHVVCNLSYGIDSELEGLAAIDQTLERVSRQNPGLVICTSAGNSGPGLSTVGTPAAASHVITVAALLAQDTARDVMGAKVSGHRVAVFSSRGGELGKPDLATPGYATSSVPRWSRWGDFWSGTSMASPYAAGLCASLLSPLPYDPLSPVRSTWVKAALKGSATPLPEFTALDQGAGVPDLARAFGLLDAARAAGASTPLFECAVSTESPHGPGARGSAAYWRLSGPRPLRPQVFTVEPVFVPGPDANARSAFARRFTLRSDQPWLKPQQEQFYLRGEQSADVRVAIAEGALREPGLYVGTVYAEGHADVDLRFQTAVVVPYALEADSGYRLRLEGQVDGWCARRVFLAVPPGASALHLALSAEDGQVSTVRAGELFTPEGRAINNWDFRLNTEEGRHEARWSITDDLQPGVWEVVLSDRRPDRSSAWRLDVRVSGVDVSPARLTDWAPGAGVALTATQTYRSSRSVEAKGAIEGVRQVYERDLSSLDDRTIVPLAFPEGVRAVRVRAEFSREEFALFTDVALTVSDSSGEPLTRDAMGGRTVTLTIERPKGADQANLQLEAAFTERYGTNNATLTITVDALFTEPRPIVLRQGERERFTLYPGVPARLRGRVEGQLPPLSGTQTYMGQITLRDAERNEPLRVVPIGR